jgi:hypothetical protein
MNFTYTVRQAPNKTWGSLQPDQSWNGMVGLLANKTVDIGKNKQSLKKAKMNQFFT